MAASQQIDPHFRDLIEHHRKTPLVGYVGHVLAARRMLAERVEGKHIIFLDTSAWSWLIAVKRDKKDVNEGVRSFAQQVRRAVDSGRFVFPIVLGTFIELDELCDDEDLAALTSCIDEMNGGICLASSPELMMQELGSLAKGDFNAYPGKQEFLRHPSELFGDPIKDLPAKHWQLADETTLRKAWFDYRLNLTLSQRFTELRGKPKSSLNRAASITDLNSPDNFIRGAVDPIVTDPVERFRLVQLGLLRRQLLSYCAMLLPHVDTDRQADLAMHTLDQWYGNDRSPLFPSIRIIVGLHALKLGDTGRMYQEGDMGGFDVAASALPVASAFFGKEALLSLFGDPLLEPLLRGSPCVLKHGVSNMTAHLEQLLAS